MPRIGIGGTGRGATAARLHHPGNGSDVRFLMMSAGLLPEIRLAGNELLDSLIVLDKMSKVIKARLS